MTTNELHAFEYFAAGVPPGEYFGMTLDELRQLSESERELSDDDGLSRLQELCFVGLFSYFEAFCKDHFAALINIEPSLVQNLVNAGQEVKVDARDVVASGRDVGTRLGFALAVSREFGTAKGINSQYGALLGVTPLSGDEIKAFNQLLSDRHLLVHHGGVMTRSYLEQHRERASGEAFFDSCVVRKKDVRSAIDFIESVALKICTETHTRLVAYFRELGMQCSGQRGRAVAFMEPWK
jgi:hypothetical protein